VSLDPQAIRSESYLEIGKLLQQHVETVLKRWSERAVMEQVNAERVHHAALLDHLREFLITLGRSLVASQEPHNNQHCLPASIHGEQRWEVGWSLHEVVRDYQILRLVILDFLQENLDRPLSYHETLAIGLALDEAIAASVVMYVKGRDEFARELEEKRAEQEKQRLPRLQEPTQALQEADRRKYEFLAMQAHELRNPLAAIRNAVDILRPQWPTDPDLRRTWDVIEHQLQLMMQMLDCLVDVAPNGPEQKPGWNQATAAAP
jgi:signal transduction histidine kinase